MNSNYIGKPMRCLFDEDFKDYNPSWKTKGRATARGLIIQGDQILLGYFGANDFYVLPGGGIEENEHLSDALIREVKEETGYNVIKPSIKAYGYTKMTKADYTDPETIFIGQAYVFTANVDLNTRTMPELTNSEKKRKMDSFWVPVDNLRKIIIHNQNVSAKLNKTISSGQTTDSTGFPLFRRYDYVWRDTKILDIFAKDNGL